MLRSPRSAQYAMSPTTRSPARRRTLAESNLPQVLISSRVTSPEAGAPFSIIRRAETAAIPVSFRPNAFTMTLGKTWTCDLSTIASSRVSATPSVSGTR